MDEPTGKGMYMLGDQPMERFDHSLVSVGIIEHPDGSKVVVIRGLCGPLKYDCWLTPENARMVAETLVDRAARIESGEEIPSHPMDTDNH